MAHSGQRITSQQPVGNSSLIPLRLLGILLAATAITYLPRMFWGFWTDEANTYWLACKGWHQALDRTLGFAGQPVLYSVIAAFFCHEGQWRDLLMRIPSLASVGVAALLLYRLSERLAGKGTGSLAALILVCAPITAEIGTEARPYALALAVTLTSCLALVHWLDTGERRWLLAYAFASSVLVNLHYLFAFCLLVFALYPLVRGLNLRLAVEFICAEMLALAFLLPLRAHFTALVRESATFGNSAAPTMRDFVTLTLPPAVLLGAGLGLVLTAALDGISIKAPNRMKGADLVLILCWTFVGPIIFFGAALMTTRNIFTSRYLLFALPGFALLFAWLASGLRNQRATVVIAIGIFAACALNPLGLLQLSQGSAKEWKSPLAIARAASAPAFVTSGLVESTVGDWAGGLAPDNHYFGPVLAYPSPDKIYPLPYFMTEPAYAHVRRILDADLIGAHRIVLLTRGDGDALQWFKNDLGARRYKATTLYSRGLTVVRFDRD